MQKAIENVHAESERLRQEMELSCQLGQPAYSLVPLFSADFYSLQAQIGIS
jgi:hypothetical protein